MITAALLLCALYWTRNHARGSVKELGMRSSVVGKVAQSGD
ncbi:MAG: hypothetical protein RIK87_21425 [Fuerstiella sp.]